MLPRSPASDTRCPAGMDFFCTLARMNRWTIFLAMTSLAVSAGAQTLKINADKNVDMTHYETFTVVPGESVTAADQKRASDKALFTAIKNGVREEMENRGYKYVEDSTAQLQVSYVAGSFDFTDAGNVGPLGQTPASDPSEINQSRSWSKTSREGLLVLEIIDTATKKEVWKAETDNVPMDRGDVAHVIDGVIYKAFKKFPSRSGSKKKRK
jgi:hypothetical protein